MNGGDTGMPSSGLAVRLRRRDTSAAAVRASRHFPPPPWRAQTRPCALRTLLPPAMEGKEVQSE
jgi:hypothetical protein